MPKLLITLFLLIFSSFIQSAQRDYELICPCDVELISDTSASVKFDIRKIFNTNNMDKLRIWIIQTENSIDMGETIGYREITDLERLQLGEIKSLDILLPLTNFATNKESHIYITGYAQDKFIFNFRRKLQTPLNHDTSFYGKSYGELVFMSNPLWEGSGNTLDVKIPKIKNISNEDIDQVLLIIGQFNPEENSWYRIGKKKINSIKANSLSSELRISAELLPDKKQDYNIIKVYVVQSDDEDNIKKFHISDSLTSSLNFKENYNNNYASSTIRFFSDSDSNGISDFNETLFNLKDKHLNFLNNWEVNVSILASEEALNTTEDINAKVEHIISHTNNIFNNSGVNAKLVLNKFETVGSTNGLPIMASSSDQKDQLSLLQDFEAPFEKAEDFFNDNETDVIIGLGFSIEDENTCGVAPGFAGIDKNSFDAKNMSKEQKFNFLIVGANCSDYVLAHEFGHVAGLGHSINQKEVGIRSFSRGYGVESEFVSVMAYNSAYNDAPKIELFSTPNISSCRNNACGIDRSLINGADAVYSLNQTIPHLAALKNGNTPIISLNGNKVLSITLNGSYKDADATAFDIEDGNLTNQIQVENNVNVSEKGSYSIIYSVTDSDGNTSKLERIINVANDLDGDGISDDKDDDLDGDGVLNEVDLFPDNKNEWFDYDNDGLGDNSDDSYNPLKEVEGYLINRRSSCEPVPNEDILIKIDGRKTAFLASGDAYKMTLSTGSHVFEYYIGKNLFTTELREIIGSNWYMGLGCDWSSFSLEDDLGLYKLRVNSDSDLYPDYRDDFPIDSSEWLDTDLDGIGNNTDTDDDNDGVLDEIDSFPEDPTETKDSDSDGVGDNSDQFPNDSSESIDSDGDGLGDNYENENGLNANAADSDGDGFLDGEEVEAGSDPLDKTSEPMISGTNIILIKAILDAQQAKAAQ